MRINIMLLKEKSDFSFIPGGVVCGRALIKSRLRTSIHVIYCVVYVKP